MCGHFLCAARSGYVRELGGDARSEPRRIERKADLEGPMIAHFCAGVRGVGAGSVKVVLAKSGAEVGEWRKEAERREIRGGGLVIVGHCLS